MEDCFEVKKVSNNELRQSPEMGSTFFFFFGGGAVLMVPVTEK